MSSAADSSCKSCRSDYKVSEQQIARLLAQPMFASDQCVPDDVYQQRMANCQNCSRLIDGVTCAACGCIMPVVAKLKARGCPLPGAAKRWDKLG